MQLDIQALGAQNADILESISYWRGIERDLIKELQIISCNDLYSKAFVRSRIKRMLAVPRLVRMLRKQYANRCNQIDELLK